MAEFSNRIVFRDRREAGRFLAEPLLTMKFESPAVMGLPRGGVPVAYEVAQALKAPLGISFVRKLGAPEQPEFAIGALAEDGTMVLDRRTISALKVTRSEVDRIVERESAELERYRHVYGGKGSPLDLTGRTTILVDDGLATGLTAVAAGRSLRARGATEVVLAVPVCPVGAAERLRARFDEIVCLVCPSPFIAVGAWYDDFSQVTDREVTTLLSASSSIV